MLSSTKLSKIDTTIPTPDDIKLAKDESANGLEARLKVMEFALLNYQKTASLKTLLDDIKIFRIFFSDLAALAVLNQKAIENFWRLLVTAFHSNPAHKKEFLKQCGEHAECMLDAINLIYGLTQEKDAETAKRILDSMLNKLKDSKERVYIINLRAIACQALCAHDIAAVVLLDASNTLKDLKMPLDIQTNIIDNFLKDVKKRFPKKLHSILLKLNEVCGDDVLVECSEFLYHMENPSTMEAKSESKINAKDDKSSDRVSSKEVYGKALLRRAKRAYSQSNWEYAEILARTALDECNDINAYISLYNVFFRNKKYTELNGLCQQMIRDFTARLYPGAQEKIKILAAIARHLDKFIKGLKKDNPDRRELQKTRDAFPFGHFLFILTLEELNVHSFVIEYLDFVPKTDPFYDMLSKYRWRFDVNFTTSKGIELSKNLSCFYYSGMRKYLHSIKYSLDAGAYHYGEESVLLNLITCLFMLSLNKNKVIPGDLVLKLENECVERILCNLNESSRAYKKDSHFYKLTHWIINFCKSWEFPLFIQFLSSKNITTLGPNFWLPFLTTSTSTENAIELNTFNFFRGRHGIVDDLEVTKLEVEYLAFKKTHSLASTLSVKDEKSVPPKPSAPDAEEDVVHPIGAPTSAPNLETKAEEVASIDKPPEVFSPEQAAFVAASPLNRDSSPSAPDAKEDVDVHPINVLEPAPTPSAPDLQDDAKLVAIEVPARDHVFSPIVVTPKAEPVSPVVEEPQFVFVPIEEAEPAPEPVVNFIPYEEQQDSAIEGEPGEIDYPIIPAQQEGIPDQKLSSLSFSKHSLFSPPEQKRESTDSSLKQLLQEERELMKKKLMIELQLTEIRLAEVQEEISQRSFKDSGFRR